MVFNWLACYATLSKTEYTQLKKKIVLIESANKGNSWVKVFYCRKTTRLQEVNQNFTYTWQPRVKWHVVFFSSFPWVCSFGQLSFYDDTQARDSNVSLTKLLHQAGETHTIILNIAIAHCLPQDLVEILLKYHPKNLFSEDDSVIPRFIEPCRQWQETCGNWNS